MPIWDFDTLEPEPDGPPPDALPSHLIRTLTAADWLAGRGEAVTVSALARVALLSEAGVVAARIGLVRRRLWLARWGLERPRCRPAGTAAGERRAHRVAID